MTTPLENLLAELPPPTDAGAIWNEAIVALSQQETKRSARSADQAALAMATLRDELKKELVAFHETLAVSPRPAPEGSGRRVFEVGIPLTLFPRRDHGFTRVECLVKFAAAGGPGKLRVTGLRPEARTELLARAEMGGSLELKAQAKMKLPLPLPAGASVIEAAGEVYGKGQAGTFVYESVRRCVETEIVGGTGARWRLEDPGAPLKVGRESHELAVTLEVAEDAGAVSAAGYLEAHSDVEWLRSSVGSAWESLVERIASWFRRGAPAEAYGAWEDFLMNSTGAR
jgi:hypothetical protein